MHQMTGKHCAWFAWGRLTNSFTPSDLMMNVDPDFLSQMCSTYQSVIPELAKGRALQGNLELDIHFGWAG